MIEVRDLVKCYGSTVAVNHLSFSIEIGHICGFLGPNGAGKSTTLNMLTGYLNPTSGTIRICGKDITTEPENVKRMIGYLPEFPPLYPDMTCREYLLFVARLKKIPKPELCSEIDRVIHAADLQKMQNRLIRHLSKGYKQRTGLACALIGDPQVIILDEPTSGFDPKQMIEMRDLIKTLGQSHTVVLSSHILSEISAICDSVILINKGHLVASGSIDSISRFTETSHVYQAHVQGNSEAVSIALSGIPGVNHLTVKPAENGCCEVRIETSTDLDPRIEMFYRLASIKCPLLSLTSHRMNLEDIFLALTRTDDKGA